MNTKRIAVKILSMFMISAFILQMFIPASVRAEEQKLTVMKKIYTWEILTYNDIQKMSRGQSCRVAIVTRYGNALLDTGRCNMDSSLISCKSLNDTDYPGLADGTFTKAYTSQNVKLMELIRSDDDKDNKNNPRIMLRSEHNGKLLGMKKYDKKDSILNRSYRFGYFDSSEYDGNNTTKFTVWRGYNDSGTYMKFQFNLPGKTDEYVFVTKSGQLLVHSNKTDDYVDYEFFDSKNDSDVRMYKVTEKEWSCITTDHKVASGQVLRLDGNIYIAPGKTITVSDDAVLIINGTVMSDGTIDNRGTTIIQKNSVFQPLSSAEASGKYKSEGGDLILMKNAKMLCKDGFVLGKGSTCINYGLLMLPQGFSMTSSCLENRKGSSLILGKEISPSIFESGSLQSNCEYSGSRKNWYVQRYYMVGNESSYYLSGSVNSGYMTENSKLINQGEINKDIHLEVSNDSVYETKNGGKEYNRDSELKTLEDFYTKCYGGKNNWYWNANGKISRY